MLAGAGLWTHATYMHYLRRAGRAIPVLFECVIGLRLENVMVDVLHTVDQGVASHIIANVLWIMAVVRAVFGSGTQKEKVQHLFRHMGKWYKRVKENTRVAGKLTVERIRTSSDWPKLKAKAAATRHLAKYALELMRTHGNGSADDLALTTVCELLVRFYEILESESQFLCASAKAELPRLGQRLAELYARLADTALRNDERLFKMVPKFHLWEHLTEQQALEYGNPRYWWTYGDEDLVGLMIEIADSCHPTTLAVSVLFKWLHVCFDF